MNDSERVRVTKEKQVFRRKKEGSERKKDSERCPKKGMRQGKRKIGERWQTVANVPKHSNILSGYNFSSSFLSYSTQKRTKRMGEGELEKKMGERKKMIKGGEGKNAACTPKCMLNTFFF